MERRYGFCRTCGRMPAHLRRQNMKKRWMIYVMLICLVLSACRPESESNMTVPAETGAMEMAQESSAAAGAEDTAAVTFTDDLGRSVTVESPERTAALLGSFAQVWMLSGGTVCATADDAWDDLQLELPEDAVNLGNTKELSLEGLLSARPDFVLASTNTRQNLEWKDTLEAAGIPVAYFDISDFEDYLGLLKICTDITGRADLYETNGLAVQEQIAAVLKRSEKRLEGQDAPKVLSLVASAANVYAKNSDSNVLGGMLKGLGCINIADSDESLLENISIEHILKENPDYIFVTQRGDDEEGTKARIQQMFSENPAWQQLTAVKEEKVFFMEKNLYNLKPNHRWGEAYEKLEEILENE